MVNVAVAGGTGHFGRIIVEALANTPKHSVIILSRTPSTTWDPRAPVIAVKYEDVESLREALASHQIHTVISTIGVVDQSSSEAQVNLVKAAAKVATTKRFVPSEWGIRYPKGPIDVVAWKKLRTAATDEAGKADLEWARFHSGWFLDYYGGFHAKTSLELLVPIAIDVENGVAGIPGEGNDRVAFTYSYDTAKYVVASLDLPKWDQDLWIIGDKITLNEFVALAEKARGIKFDVHYDSLEKLESSKITELPIHVKNYEIIAKRDIQYLYAVFGKFIVTGVIDLPEENSLNHQFPEIKSVKVADFLEGAWKGK